MRKLLLIANPSASSFTGSALREVTTSLSAAFDVEQVWPEGPTASRTSAAKAAASSYDVVAAMGGDGVVHHVANGLVGTETALAIIPAGTTNVIARILGIPRKATKAAKSLSTWSPRPVRTVRVVADEGEPFHAVFSVGMGYDAAVLARAERRPHGKVTWGALHYVHSAFAELGRHDTPTIRVEAHDRRADGVGLSVQVQDVYTYLGPLSFSFGGETGAGFNALVMNRVGLPVAAAVARAAAHRLEVGRGNVTVWTDATALRAEAEPVSLLQADGESYGPVSDIRLSANSRRLLVIAP